MKQTKICDCIKNIGQCNCYESKKPLLNRYCSCGKKNEEIIKCGCDDEKK